MQDQPQTSLFSADKRLTFVTLCLISVLLLYIKKFFIEYETAAFEFLQDRPEGMILQLIGTLQFFSIPFIYLWKFTIIGFVLWVGCFLFGYRISFGQCWGVVMVAEFTFILPELIKIIWFLTIQTDPGLREVQSFYPFSLMNFFDPYTIDKRFGYPLRALSVFEVIYVFMLVKGVNHYAFQAHKQQRATWWIVSTSYILIFVLWLLFYIAVYK
ncbi:MAG: hypothetical protein JST48_06840 [Bacteroidetes bacterium]|nr:hypothetical protein [Bacteroidota bacterium]